MALGALIAVVVLVVAAIQAPSWYRAIAGSRTVQAPAAADATAQPDAAQTAQPAQEAQPAAVAPVESAPSTEPAPPAPAAPATAQSDSGPAMRAPAARSVVSDRLQSNRRQSSGSTQYATPERQPAAVTESAPPAAPAIDAKGLEDARESLAMLGVRANAIRGSLQNLERQQRSEGLGLRTDVSASWKRMEYLLDEAEAALKRRDLAAAKKNLQSAERETDRLEKFLGH
jgi:hypothetical protein